MSMNEKLAYLAETKEQIKAALINKGASISTSTPFRRYVDKINDIEIVNNQTKEITVNGMYTPDEGYTGFGEVIVNVSNSGDVETIKLFDTADAMQASTGNVIGDLAVVYSDATEAITQTTQINTLSFPEVVNLDTAITSPISAYLVDAEDRYNRLCQLNLSKTTFIVRDYRTYANIARYSSSDGITYTRTTTATSFELSTSAKFYGTWNDAYVYFLQNIIYNFEGIFKYDIGDSNRHILAKILGDPTTTEQTTAENTDIGNFVDIIPTLNSLTITELEGQTVHSEKNWFVDKIDEHRYTAYTELHWNSTNSYFEYLATGCIGFTDGDWYLALNPRL